MHLSSSKLLEMTETKFREFLALDIPEGTHLDYKIALSAKSDKDSKREFLKDISGFANAAGGHLIIGVKEPQHGSTVEARLIGIEDGLACAASLERLASASIEPRIPGLRIFPIKITNDKYCLIVHIPPSLGRPHMVSHDGHRSFYIRHTESIFPMSTYEIRQAVLTSLSAEERARHVSKEIIEHATRKASSLNASLIIQAVPLIHPDIPWNVLDPEFSKIFRGDNRSKLFEFEPLESNSRFRPTIYGAICRNQDYDNPWSCEIRRTGHIILHYQIQQTTKDQGQNIRYLHSGNVDIFGAFLTILDDAIEKSGNDVPYLLTSHMTGTYGLQIWTEDRRERFSEIYEDNEIVWPEHMKQTGESAIALKADFGRELFNAFGYPDVVA